MGGLQLAALASVVTAVAGAPCRWAASFTCATLASDPSAVDALVWAMAEWEANFAQPGVGLDPTTLMTLDGHPLNQTTGELTGVSHPFSAPSKESLHVGVLARAIAGDDRALLFAGGRDAAVSTLSRKMEAYEAWNASWPGFGCFMPWYTPNGNGTVSPLDGWLNPARMPSLDNGEWVWAVFAAWQALDASGNSTERVLGARYGAWFTCMANNAKTAFYTGNGTVMTVVGVADPTAPFSAANIVTFPGATPLDDPYEGEAFTVLLDLFASWPNPAERDLMWAVKRPLLLAVNYTVPVSAVAAAVQQARTHSDAAVAASAPAAARAIRAAMAAEADTVDITVMRGWWYSSHERWGTNLLLPYRTVPAAARILANGERARTWDGWVTGRPGLLASVNDVSSDPDSSIPDYASACGVASIAAQPIERTDIVTPYGAFPVWAWAPGTAACWYAAMLQGPRMQGPYGSTEAIATNGTLISPLTTWDSKITTLLAALGGVVDLVQGGLTRLRDASDPTASALARFQAVIAREYGRVFFPAGLDTALPGEALPYMPPRKAVPQTPAPAWQCDA